MRGALTCRGTLLASKIRWLEGEVASATSTSVVAVCSVVAATGFAESARSTVLAWRVTCLDPGLQHPVATGLADLTRGGVVSAAAVTACPAHRNAVRAAKALRGALRQPAVAKLTRASAATGFFNAAGPSGGQAARTARHFVGFASGRVALAVHAWVRETSRRRVAACPAGRDAVQAATDLVAVTFPPRHHLLRGRTPLVRRSHPRSRTGSIRLPRTRS